MRQDGIQNEDRNGWGQGYSTKNSCFLREEMGKGGSHTRAVSKRRIQGVRPRGPAFLGCFC